MTRCADCRLGSGAPSQEGLPAPSPQPPQYPPPHAHRQPQQSYHKDPQRHPYPPLPRVPPPAPAAWRAAARPPSFSAVWRAPLRNVRPAKASTEGAPWPVHRCGTDQEGAWAAAEPTRWYVLRFGFQCVVCTEAWVTCMWTPSLVFPIFCTSVTHLAFLQHPQETGETRDDQPPRGTEETSAGAVGEQQVVVLGVLRVCFFVTSRSGCALCCACCASCASYVSCLRVAFGGETSRCSRSAEASSRDQR